LFVIYCQTKGFSAARFTAAFGIPFFVLVFMLAFTDKRILRRKLIKNWQYITTTLGIICAFIEVRAAKSTVAAVYKPHSVDSHVVCFLRS